MKLGRFCPVQEPARRTSSFKLDYMCGGILSDGSCDPNQENLFPSPDSQGSHDPLAMVQKAFAQRRSHAPSPGQRQHSSRKQLHQTKPRPAVPVPRRARRHRLEEQPRVLKGLAAQLRVLRRRRARLLAPLPLRAEASSYHYVLFGHSLAIPAWNTAIRHSSIHYCCRWRHNHRLSPPTVAPKCSIKLLSKCCITVSAHTGNAAKASTASTTLRPAPTPGPSSFPLPLRVTNWSYPNSTLPEPIVIRHHLSGTVTSISRLLRSGAAQTPPSRSAFGERTDPNQDMRARKPPSSPVRSFMRTRSHHRPPQPRRPLLRLDWQFRPNFRSQLRSPTYQSIMNYLFQLSMASGPGSAVAFSSQTLTPLMKSSFGSFTTLLDTDIPGFVGTRGHVPNFNLVYPYRSESHHQPRHAAL